MFVRSRSHLREMGITTAKLRWHVSNINVPFNDQCFDNFEKKTREITGRRKLVQPVRMGALPQQYESLMLLQLIPLPAQNKYHKCNPISIACGLNIVFTVITLSYYTAPIWAPCTAAIRPSLARHPAIPGMNRRSGSPRISFGQIDTDAILARHWLITPVFPFVLTLYPLKLSGEI